MPRPTAVPATPADGWGTAEPRPDHRPSAAAHGAARLRPPAPTVTPGAAADVEPAAPSSAGGSLGTGWLHTTAAGDDVTGWSGAATGGRPTVEALVGRPTVEALVGRPTVEALVGRPTADALGGRSSVDPLVGRSAADALAGRPAAEAPVGGGVEPATGGWVSVAAVEEPGAGVGWPNIADYWPDAPQRMGPPADMHEVPGASPTRIGPPWHESSGPEAQDTGTLASAARGPGPAASMTASRSATASRSGPEMRRSGPVAGTSGPLAGTPGSAVRTSEFAAGALAAEPAVRAAILGAPMPGRPGRKRGRTLAGAVLAVLLLVGGGFVAYRKTARENRVEGAGSSPSPATSVAPPRAMGPAAVLPEPSPSTSSSAAPTAAPPARPATGSFVLGDDVSDITIRTVRLRDGIVQVVVPDGSDAVPRTSVDGGDVRLRVAGAGRGHRTDVDVRLDNRVSWAIRLGGGARRVTVDLGGSDVRSVAFQGGATRIDLTLPKLDGTVPIDMSGGVNQWRIATVGRVKVQLVARRGGGDLELYGRRRSGVDRGERVQSDGQDGIDVNASAGFGSLTVFSA